MAAVTASRAWRVTALLLLAATYTCMAAETTVPSKTTSKAVTPAKPNVTETPAVPGNTTTNTTTSLTTTTISSTTTTTKTSPATSPSTTTGLTSASTATSTTTTTTTKAPEKSTTATSTTSSAVTSSISSGIQKQGGFDLGSFIGGMVLTLGLLAMLYFGCRFYNSRRGIRYRTIDEHEAII